MEKTLRFFGFGPTLIKWVKIFYTNFECCITNNGWASNFFKPERGVRQGCPLSPYIFLLVAETLACAIRGNNEIKGITVLGNEIKISQYADDTTLVLDGAEKTIAVLLKTLDMSFSVVSGLRLNKKKTEALWIGSNIDRQDKAKQTENFKWPEIVKTLGVKISAIPNKAVEVNFSDKTKKIRMILSTWVYRRLTLKGKILVIKSLGASQLVYILSSLPSPNDVITEISQVFFEFIWNGKRDKVKRNTINMDYKEGGLKMLDLESFNKALKAIWMKKYLDEQNCGKWKFFFYLELEKSSISTPINSNLSTKDALKIHKFSDVFIKEVFTIWTELTFEEYPTSESHLKSLPLWNNSLIRFDNKPIIPVKSWLTREITTINSILDNEGKTLSYQDFKANFDFSVKIPTLYFTEQ